MSTDNYMLIAKEKGKFVGYHQSASDDELQFDHASFIVDTIEEAIYLCQSGQWAGDDDMLGGYLEYGYRFLLDKDGKIKEADE